jgi:acetylglutamate kinase
VLSHGGGPGINKMLGKLDIPVKFINGLRYTSEDIMRVVEMVLIGQVNTELVGYINRLGGKAVGLSGVSGDIYHCHQRSEELGLVGDIDYVDPTAIFAMLDAGYIPVVAPVGTDGKGNTYNINGDTAAAHIAGALEAERLIMMTDIAGILKDKDDPSTLIPKITPTEAEKLYGDGTISGGMIPKVECCIDALKYGVKNVVIMDGRVPHSILMELLTDEGAGTMVTSGADA